MTEAMQGPVGGEASAGALLRKAREKQGLHIAALAAAIKVSPRKLELLEADRYDELPDATFTRALAQTVCRTLKVDPAPVLALMPRAGGYRIEQVSEGLNAPFRDRPGRAPSVDWSSRLRPAVWLPLLVLLAAALVYFWPQRQPAPVPAPVADVPNPPGAASAVPAAPAAASAVVEPASAVASAASEAPAASAAVTTTPVPADTAVLPPSTLQLRATQASWIEVVDGSGQSLLSRIVEVGETVDLDGSLPLKLRIGNAAGTQVAFRGQNVDLTGVTRDNVARLELK